MNNEMTSTTPNAFEAFGEAATRAGNVFLKFSKGDYLRGQDAEVVPVGTRFVAMMDELQTGWVRWSEGTPTDREMGKVSEGFVPPKRSSLGDTDRAMWAEDDEGRARDPWALTSELPMMAQDGTVDTFATSSKGGLAAIGELSKAYGRQMRTTPNKLPMVALNVGSYQHSKREFGRIKYPQFDVVAWVDRDKLPASPPDGDAHLVSPAPAAAIEHQREENAARTQRSSTHQAQSAPKPAPAPQREESVEDIPW